MPACAHPPSAEPRPAYQSSGGSPTASTFPTMFCQYARRPSAPGNMQAIPTIAMSVTAPVALSDAGRREPIERSAAVGLEALERQDQAVVGADVVHVADDRLVRGPGIHVEVAAAGAVPVERREARQR